MALTLIDRFQPSLRAKQQAAIDSGHIRTVEELALLEQEKLLPLARLSLQLLLVGSVFFGLLNYGAFVLRYHTFNPGITGGGLLLWLVISVAGYFLLLPFPEALKAAGCLFCG